MERGGAAAISVLTEPTFFDGSLADLAAVRATVRLPILRKDFHIDPLQLVEAHRASATAVLLIARALDQPRLLKLMEFAKRLAGAPHSHTGLVSVPRGDGLAHEGGQHM